MKLLLSILLAIAWETGVVGSEESRPQPDDVKEFVADPIPPVPVEFFKDFKVTQEDFCAILKDYFQVEEEHWIHGYSHVAFGDRTGHIVLKDGRKVKWLVKPAGLAWLEFSSGKKMYLARERSDF